MTGNNDYTTGNLLDYLYHQNYYKLMGIDLSKQTHATIPYHFTGSLEKENIVKMLFLTENQEKNILNFNQFHFL